MKINKDGHGRRIVRWDMSINKRRLIQSKYVAVDAVCCLWTKGIESWTLDQLSSYESTILIERKEIQKL